VLLWLPTFPPSPSLQLGPYSLCLRDCRTNTWACAIPSKSSLVEEELSPLPSNCVHLRVLDTPHLTSPHLTSPHLTSPHLTSPHLTSPHLTSPHLTSPHLTSNDIAIDARRRRCSTERKDAIHIGGTPLLIFASRREIVVSLFVAYGISSPRLRTEDELTPRDEPPPGMTCLATATLVDCFYYRDRMTTKAGHLQKG
jgi:hypothetical protein